MKLPEFSYIQSDTDLPGCGYILHGSEFPYHFARIVKYGNSADMAIALNTKKPFIYSQVEGYSIVVVLAGSMEGKIYISAEGPGKLEKVAKKMAKWYLKRHILPKPHKFKQYELSF